MSEPEGVADPIAAAVETVARNVLASTARQQSRWEDCLLDCAGKSMIGEAHWDAVVEAVRRLAPRPDRGEFVRAFDLLAEGAES